MLATSYEFDLSRYEKLREKRIRSLPKADPLPSDWPEKIDTKLAWHGQTLSDSYVVQLSGAEKEELYSEAKRYMASGQPLSSINAATFYLPRLFETLAKSRVDLHEGPGLIVLRGLNPARLSRRENVIAFAGVSSYISETRGRQAAGKYLVHIKDLTHQLAPDNVRVAPYTTKALPFHTDQGDVVSMYVLGTPKNGGQGTFASVPAIYNEVASTRPDLVRVLSNDDWPFDRPGDKSVIDPRSLMTIQNGKLAMNFSRGSLLYSPSSQRRPDLPSLNEAQAEALDCVQFTASKYAHRVTYQEGDFLAFNNRSILHGRDRFENNVEGNGRHFLRLWLRDEKMAGPAPTGLEQRWNNVFQCRDGGDESVDWPLQPISMPQDTVPARYRLQLEEATLQGERMTGKV